MLNRKTKNRLHIRSIKAAAGIEPSGPIDNEISELFKQMRQATSLSMQDIAFKLNTTPQTIDLLEKGQLSALPEWNEISRVVIEYTNMLGLDAEPVLRRVMVQLPGDHPKRPGTQEHNPSYNNMRANADAVMHRVPGSENAIEKTSVTMDQAGQFQASNQGQPAQYSPQYGAMRAAPRGAGGYGSQSRPPMVALRRKTSIFVPLVQFLLLLIMLAAGYAMYLSANDPQGYEDLKTLAISHWGTFREQVRNLTSYLLNQLNAL